MKQQLQDRLAALHNDIDETVAQRHLTDIAAELENPAAPARHRRTPRIKARTLVAAALLLLLPGAAFASEGAVPGDLLYPIKLAAERVLLFVNPNIEAEHRIEELEISVDRAVPFEEVSDRLVDADRSVQNRDVPDDLLDRLDVVRDRVATDYNQHRDGPPAGERGGEPAESDRPQSDVRPDEPAPAATTTTVPPETDRPPAQDSTSTAPPDDDRPVSDATTTTEPPRDRDNPPRDG